jgi:hypothetical protein
MDNENNAHLENCPCGECMSAKVEAQYGDKSFPERIFTAYTKMRLALSDIGIQMASFDEDEMPDKLVAAILHGNVVVHEARYLTKDVRSYEDLSMEVNADTLLVSTPCIAANCTEDCTDTDKACYVPKGTVSTLSAEREK